MKKIDKKDLILVVLGGVFLLLGIGILSLPVINIGGWQFSSPLKPKVAGASNYSMTYSVDTWLNARFGGGNEKPIAVGPSKWVIQGVMDDVIITETWELATVRVSSSLCTNTRDLDTCSTEINIKELTVEEKEFFILNKYGQPSRVYLSKSPKDDFKEFTKDFGVNTIVPLGSYGIGSMESFGMWGGTVDTDVDLLMTFHPQHWEITGEIK